MHFFVFFIKKGIFNLKTAFSLVVSGLLQAFYKNIKKIRFFF